MGFVELDESKCIKCGNCVEVCPRNVFEISENEVPKVVEDDACMTCLACVEACSQKCIQISKPDSRRII